MADPLLWNAPGQTWNAPGLTWNGFVPPPPNTPHVMTDDNKVSATLTTANTTAIKDGIAAIRTLLPFLISLSNQDRMEMAKLGDK